MRVQDFEISDDTVQRALRSFPPERSFKTSDLTSELTRLGVSREGWIASECAARALQKARKAGPHSFSAGKWKRRKVSE